MWRLEAADKRNPPRYPPSLRWRKHGPFVGDSLSRVVHEFQSRTLRPLGLIFGRGGASNPRRAAPKKGGKPVAQTPFQGWNRWRGGGLDAQTRFCKFNPKRTILKKGVCNILSKGSERPVLCFWGRGGPSTREGRESDCNKGPKSVHHLTGCRGRALGLGELATGSGCRSGMGQARRY